MSSTNRSNSRDNHVADYYVTPIDKISDFLEEFEKVEDVDKNIQILDCCAGGDEKHPMSYPEALSKKGFINISTLDIREDSLSKTKGDYLHIDYTNKMDMIITNPPFSLALDIIKKSLEDVKEGGFVIMLLRLNYFGGKVRKELWEKQMPKYCFVHHKRISFTDDRKTDSIEYAHFVWQKGHNEQFTQLKVI
jgi:hypothetical protein